MANRQGNSGNSGWLFLGSKLTADGDCSHEIKRRLLLGRKVMTNLDSILKCRDITLPTKVPLVKATVFPLVMYGCERWTIKKAERLRIDAFELWCWRRLLRAPWTARRSNQSILKEISPGCSLEGLLLKLKLKTLATWCGELSHLKRHWCWKRLRTGGEGDNTGWDGWMASPKQWTWVSVDSGSWWWTGGLEYCGSWGHQESDTTERLNWKIFLFEYTWLNSVVSASGVQQSNQPHTHIYSPPSRFPSHIGHHRAPSRFLCAI